MYDISKLKPINESKINTKLIKDLGMTFKRQEQINGEKINRYAILECIKCKEHFKSQISMQPQNTIVVCKNCKLKPLSDYKFNMNVVKDLKLINLNNSKLKIRAATFECNQCKSEFDNTITKALANTDGLCYSCNHTKNNPDFSEYGTRLYNIWRSMLARGSGSIKSYDYSYNLKDITVCNIWKDDFKSFKIWSLENGYNILLTIDRINNDDIYKPSNCRWTNAYVQAQNTRKLRSNNTSGYRGVSWYKNKQKWRTSIHSFGKRISLGYFEDKIEAALAYDEYVLYNCTNHTTNFIYD